MEVGFLQLILMSATIDTGKFHDYLITYYNEKAYRAQVVNITGNMKFQILTFYLDDLLGKNTIIEVLK